MSTGATPEQLRAAAVNNPRFHWRGNIEDLASQYADYEEACIEEVEDIAHYLVPPDHRIATPAQLDALRRVHSVARAAYRYDGQAMRYHMDKVKDADFDVVAALIGDTDAPTQ